MQYLVSVFTSIFGSVGSFQGVSPWTSSFGCELVHASPYFSMHASMPYASIYACNSSADCAPVGELVRPKVNANIKATTATPRTIRTTSLFSIQNTSFDIYFQTVTCDHNIKLMYDSP